MSPSSSICSRSTPCVEGWEGPIESDIFSISASAEALFAEASGKTCSVGILRFLRLGGALGPAFVLRARFGPGHIDLARGRHERPAHHRRRKHAGPGLRRDLD